MGNPSQSYGASLAIWDHTVLPATRNKWTRSTITPANQAITRFTYLGRMEGWVDLGSLIVAWPGIDPTTAWSQVRRPNCYATDQKLSQGVLKQKTITIWSSRKWGQLGMPEEEPAGLCQEDMKNSGPRLALYFPTRISFLRLGSSRESVRRWDARILR